MKLSNPRIERLKEMMSLEERRVALQDELDQVTQQMNNLKDSLFTDGAAKVSAPAAPKAASAKAAASRQLTPRGALKDRIVAALQAAGHAGVKVKELAQAIGTKPVNVHSWFHSSMKRYPAIKKIEGGHYRLEGSLEKRGGAKPGRGKSKPAATAAAPKQPRKAKGGRQSKRGELSARILQELGDAGSQGITVRDLAEKLGANYKNIYIWFATTGKKNPSVKKLGPAQYRLTR
jgi:phosphatidylserine/phosphatidylglycerophosphate/cardiolipin synthase-like enzyme